MYGEGRLLPACRPQDSYDTPGGEFSLARACDIQQSVVEQHDGVGVGGIAAYWLGGCLLHPVRGACDTGYGTEQQACCKQRTARRVHHESTSFAPHWISASA